ncbi:MAG TPA: MG2 domain-containing protein [Bacteroidia bacterium]|jgi:uncharacterized protein YfaS (alpha-2-macroglobulin family)|nr:MG2 domain-containing protein [Bacteroidia bacterium]
MSRRLLLAIASVVVITMVIIPFISPKSNSAVEMTKVDPAFGAYVSAFTSGIISNESYIRVTLANDYTGPITLDKPTDENYFTFDPDISGKTYWIDTRTLEFRPDKRMPSDQNYNVEFDLGKLITDLPSNLQTLKFNFHTMRQGIEVDLGAMKTTDRKTMKWQQMEGILSTADAADDSIVERVLTATQSGNTKMKVKWTHDGDHVTHHFVIDSISRGDKAGKITVSWDGKPLGVDKKDSKDITIPSLKDFVVTDVRVEQGQEQCVVVEFSDPLQEKQNLDGLVTIKDEEGLRFTVEDNDIKVYPDEVLSGDHTITVNTGVKNLLGYPLPNAFTQILSFEELKPSVRLVGKGIILPNSGKGMLFPFEAVSLKAVDVKIIRIYENNIPQYLQVNDLDGSNQLYRVGKTVIKKKIDLAIKNKADYGKWCSYSLDLGDLIKAEPGAIYRVSIGFKKNYAVYNCPNDTTNATVADDNSDDQLADDDEDYGNGYGYYGGEYYDDYEDYYYDGDNDDPCSPAYYYGKTISRNILASDLGLIAKKGNDGSMIFAVNDLLTTTPVSGAQLEVLDYQQQSLASLTTDADGLAKADLKKKKPFLLVAKNGTQRGYLKLDEGSSLTVSAFDVDGVEVQKGLKGFIYGERGVWRPGDTLFLGFILEDKEGVLPATHPVTFDLINARGQQVSHIVKSTSVNGFYNFTTTTDVDAPTGNWTARVKVGGAVFTKNIKIETIMPNRLKIALDFGALSLTKDQQKIKLHSNWLTGAKAKDLRATVDASLYSTTTTFKGYENYVFDDPASNFNTDSRTIFDGTLDADGNAEFSPELAADDAPGKLKASFNTRVFEEGGAFSEDHFTTDYSPYDSYVGILVPKGDEWGGMLETGKDWSVRVASVDKDGKPISRDKITVKVWKVDWRWWWSSGYDNLANYVSSSYYAPYMEREISTKNGFGSFNLKVANEDYGRYLIRVTDETSGHSTGSLAWFDWPYWQGSGTKNNDVASLLQFTSDKTKYEVGETINLNIPSPGQGRALITIENGSKTIDAFWAETDKKGNIPYQVKVTSDMAPNVYVSVTLVQPHGQVANDAPIRLYGVIPIVVDDPTTHLNPQIVTPVSWRPEENASVTVSEKDGKAMTYTLAIVDEGLLDLTRFETPDPWNNFYAREALGVKTWDMYDLVMGAYGADLQHVLGIGGDGSETDRGGNKANRFKPMVKYMGPFELKAGEKQTQTFMMPQYVGSVRVMVIAGQDNAYGNAEKTVPVKKPLMILGTLPRVLGPGESVDLPVDVFAMEKNIKKASITVTVNNLFTLTDGGTKTTTFTEVGDNIVDFKLKVADAVGVGTVKIVATSGTERAEYSMELDVRNPNPLATNAINAIVDPGQTWTSDYTPVGILGTNTGTLEVSSIPPINFGQRLNYLLEYPYGCVEQTTSSVFPQLFLDDVMDLTDLVKSRIQLNIKAAIDRLKKFATPSGGLSYWPGESEPSEWGSNYAGDFLLEAQAKGYTVPSSLLDNWKTWQKQIAINWTPRYDKYYYANDDLMQAYRLYTLALAKAPELGAMNRLKEIKTLSVAAKWRLAAAYQLAGQTDVAKALISGLSTDVDKYTMMNFTYGSSDRDEAMILETLSLIGGTYRSQGAAIAKSISESLNKYDNYWMSTQTTAYCLVAMSKYSIGDKTTKGVTYDYTIDGKTKTVKSSKAISQTDMNISTTKAGKVSIKNNGANTLFVRMILSGIPEAGQETASHNNMDMDVSFTTLNGNPIDVTKIEQGTDFVATVSIYNPGDRGEYREMALTEIFPSGWEIRNERMMEGDDGISSDYFDYQDVRDDRVNTFFYISPQKTKTYKIVLNAAYVGHYYLPGFSASAMYDNTINARSTGQWVDVVDPAN